MSTTMQQIIKFYLECYKADNRGLNVYDVYSKKHEYQMLMKKDQAEQYNKQQPIKMIDKEYCVLLENNLIAYRREKQAAFGSCFLIGEGERVAGLSSGTIKICAPVIIYNVQLIRNNDKYELLIDYSDFQVNSSILSQFVSDTDRLVELDSLILQTSVPERPNVVAEWIQVNVNNKELSILDSITTDATLKKHKKAVKSDQFRFSDSLMLMLIKRSLSSRGIIHELECIAESDTFSIPMRSIFSLPEKESNYNYTFNPSNVINVPGVLSDAQKKVLKNAATKNLSQVIGPPGTGKSYTIASIALERYMQNESILIVSQNEQAVNVVNDILLHKMGVSSNAILRVGAGDYMKDVKEYFSDLLKGFGIEEVKTSYNKELNNLNELAIEKERDFYHFTKRAVKYGKMQAEIIEGEYPGLFAKWKLNRFIKQSKDKKSLWNQIDTLYHVQKKREAILAKHINNKLVKDLNYVLANDRTEISNFVASLKARSSGRQEYMFSQINYTVLLKTLPIWLCSLDSLHRALPLTCELFDLVIVDEATQCDIASCLPALYRAKKAVIVGDPKQLRHVSFLSRDRQNQIIDQLQITNAPVELNYRDHSLIDLSEISITSQDAIVLLNEHYRSLPGIIRFSNKKFYNNELRIMTEKPTARDKSPVRIIHCDGKRINNINEIEADKIISELHSIIDKEISIPKEQKSSIGVLSFFREQVDYMQKRVLKEVETDYLIQHQILVGTPYSFQGSEKDVMLISCTVDEDIPGGVFTYLNRPDVMNVAITRARDSQILFLSRNLDIFPKNNLLGEYLNSIHPEGINKPDYSYVRDKYMSNVAEALVKLNFVVLQAFPIAGITMDMVVVWEDKCLIIDLIGFPGEFEDVLHVSRYKIFERAGLRIFPLSLIEWYYNRETVLQKIESILTTMDKTSSLISDEYSVDNIMIKLSIINNALAVKIKRIDRELAELKQEECKNELTELVVSYQKFLEIISERFAADSITYNRYVTAVNDMQENVIANFNKIVILQKTMPGDTASKEIKEMANKQVAMIDDLKSLNKQALTKIQEITMSIGQILASDSEDGKFQTSLKELESLNERLGSFSKN